MAIRWEEWGEAAFARGRAEGKPLLLSLTASWCHACHRMDEETWDDPGVAAAVERSAVPVRVDADARPDVYGRYHLGGLPTTALLTAAGEFVRGGTFLSAPELQLFLDVAVGDWRERRLPRARRSAAPPAPAGLVDEVIARLVRRADAEHGGFGAAPKLPETEALTLLLRGWRVSRGAALERIVRASLDAVVAHLGEPRDGGFFRYAAGADWTGAHTEKLALDQAQIARLLLEAGAALAEPRYVEAARAALAHARRRLADGEGRIFSSVAADPEYYAGAPARTADELPAVDRRRFADGGAAMVSAAALAHALCGDDLGFRPEYRTAAPAGAIPHRLDAEAPARGLLRDQALGLAAALGEYRLGGDGALLEWGERAAGWAIRHLWDEEAAAFRASPDVAAGEPELPPIFPLLANGEMAAALADLADHTGRAEYRGYAERVVAALGGRAVGSPAGPALALAALRLGDKAPEADLDGDPADPRARALARAVVAALGPTAVVRWTGAGAPGLVLCVSDLCLPPLDDPRELLLSLVDLDLAPRGILSIWSSSSPRPAGLASEEAS